MRKRIDRYVHEALQDFAKWYVESDWLGKERDCVNLFALDFLYKAHSEDSAVRDLRQIRIECPVPQPLDRKKYRKPSAAKDLVIWNGPLDTTWNEDWKPVNVPKAVIEWKTKRVGNAHDAFDAHDETWMKDFTSDFRTAFGFLVSTHASKTHRSCRWAIVRNGKVGKVNLVSKAT